MITSTMDLFRIDVPVCDGQEKKIHVKEAEGAKHGFSWVLHHPKLSCPMATQCLQHFNLPINGEPVLQVPTTMKEILKGVRLCVDTPFSRTPG